MRTDGLEIGVISDTHGLLRPAALEALAGVAHVLHAGDVGEPDVLDALGRIAPVTAVRGNNDRGAWASALPERTTVVPGGARSCCCTTAPTCSAASPATRRIDVVVSGHSHRPTLERSGAVLYVNPGSAGPRRFTLPIALARLEVAAGAASPAGSSSSRPTLDRSNDRNGKVRRDRPPAGERRRCGCVRR